MNTDRINLDDYYLEPFDLIRALDGEKVVYQNGCIVKEFLVNVGQIYPVGTRLGGTRLWFTKEGRNTSRNDTYGDLKIAVKKVQNLHEKWYVVHPYLGYKTEEEALRSVHQAENWRRGEHFEIKKVEFCLKEGPKQ